VQGLVHEHAGVDDGLAVGGRLGHLVVDDGHVVGHLVVGLLQVHLAGELLAHLVQGLGGPVAEPVQHAPIKKNARGTGEEERRVGEHGHGTVRNRC